MSDVNPIPQIKFDVPSGWEREIPSAGPKNSSQVLYHSPAPDRALIGIERRPNSVSKRAFENFEQLLKTAQTLPTAASDLTKEQIAQIADVLGFRQWNFDLQMCRIQTVCGKPALVIQGRNFDGSQIQAVIVPGKADEGEVYEVFYQGFGDSYASLFNTAEVALSSIHWGF